jgi:hypothetical protein
MNRMHYTILVSALAAVSLLAVGCEQRVGGSQPPTTVINKTEPAPQNPPNSSTTVINKSETQSMPGQPAQSNSSSSTTTDKSASADQSSNQKSTMSSESKSEASTTQSKDKQG